METSVYGTTDILDPNIVNGNVLTDISINQNASLIMDKSIEERPLEEEEATQ